MEKEFSIFLMEKSLKVHGIMEKSMVMDSFKSKVK